MQDYLLFHFNRCDKEEILKKESNDSTSPEIY